MQDCNDDAIEYPIDGTLDLHQFSPDETREILEEYIRACLEHKIFSLRIIHGKGKGVQRRIVHSVLEQHPRVTRFYQESGSGSWGATLVDLSQ